MRKNPRDTPAGFPQKGNEKVNAGGIEARLAVGMQGDQTKFHSLPECHLPFPRVAQVQDELATTGDLERDACVGQGIRNLARHVGQPRETIGDVVGHRAEKRNITFGVYTQGASEAQWRACVESVNLPAVRGADCS